MKRQVIKQHATRILDWVGYRQQKFISHRSGGWKAKNVVSTWSGPGVESHLPIPSHMEETGWLSLWSHFHEAAHGDLTVSQRSCLFTLGGETHCLNWVGRMGETNTQSMSSCISEGPGRCVVEAHFHPWRHDSCCVSKRLCWPIVFPFKSYTLLRIQIPWSHIHQRKLSLCL